MVKALNTLMERDPWVPSISNYISYGYVVYMFSSDSCDREISANGFCFLLTSFHSPSKRISRNGARSV